MILSHFYKIIICIRNPIYECKLLIESILNMKDSHFKMWEYNVRKCKKMQSNKITYTAQERTYGKY